ncbi:MAG TPA: hypothetical protein VFW94_20350 [Candidatus Acidoferrales bacterium]|nr:hypothetical protein [Candidatus Acidoferrales bacterium]
MTVSPKIAWIAVTTLLILAGCNHSQPQSSTNAPNSSAASPANAADSPAPANGNSANSGSQASQAQANTEPSAQPPAPQPIVIPAGTILHVTVDQSISSKTANAGDEFDASLAEPLRVHGAEVLRRGTRITGIVTAAKSAGRFKGHSELGIALASVTVDGQNYRLHTSDVAEESKGRGKRTGIGAGGGAAFGAIIGAIAGGGKGAAVGALAGGGAGTAGAAFTGKRDIEIPAETRLRFRLKRSVSISPASQ